MINFPSNHRVWPQTRLSLHDAIARGCHAGSLMVGAGFPLLEECQLWFGSCSFIFLLFLSCLQDLDPCREGFLPQNVVLVLYFYFRIL